MMAMLKLYFCLLLSSMSFGCYDASFGYGSYNSIYGTKEFRYRQFSLKRYTKECEQAQQAIAWYSNIKDSIRCQENEDYKLSDSLVDKYEKNKELFKHCDELLKNGERGKFVVEMMPLLEAALGVSTENEIIKSACGNAKIKSALKKSKY